MYRILVIDSSKGNEEGRESDKLVAWYPDQIREKLRDAGLLQGLLHFSSLFDKESSTADIVDFDSTLWVLGPLPGPNLYICIMVEKVLLGRHVTDTNLLGVVRNISDVLAMSLLDGGQVEKAISQLVKFYGDKLNDKHSWLRRQLRNPFALTWGAAHTRLPKELETEFRDSRASLALGLALFKDEVCLYSSLGGDCTDRLGSLVLSELQTFFIIREKYIEESKFVAGLTSLSGCNAQKYFVMTSQGFTLFILPEDESDFDALKQEAFDKMQMVIDFIDSFRWSDKKERHIPGLRYLSHNTERRTCSPRVKVSSSNHHTRAMATTLRDYGSRIEDRRFVYTCDKGNDSWGALSSNKKDLTVSLSLRGLGRKKVVDEFIKSREIQFQITK